jgi:membrane-associated protease RseP (regulator of RpoE activity)
MSYHCAVGIDSNPSRPRWLPVLIVVILAGGASCTPTLGVPQVSQVAVDEETRLQREMAVSMFQARRIRLARISTRLRVDSSELCGDLVAPFYGFVARSLSDISEEYRDTVARLWRFGDQPTVELVDPGSPAEEAGLEQGWKIARINGTEVRDERGVIEAVGSADGSNLELELAGERAGQVVEIVPVMACRFPVMLEIANTVNAFADGSNVFIASGMVKFVENDEELALVVGHEMAHNILDHIGKQQGNYMAGGLLGLLLDLGAAAAGINTGGAGQSIGASLGAGVSASGFESEADYMGAYIAARAGYDVSGAPLLWRRMAVEHPGSIDGAFMASHPSTPERFVALAKTVEEIEERRAAGEPLVPRVAVEGQEE